MTKIFVLLLLALQLCVEAREFVLFTQPKTGTHLLIPILTELTGKQVYWAKEYTGSGIPISERFEDAIKNPDYLFFALNDTPWNREMMDLAWETNKKKGAFLHLHAPYTTAMENFLAEKDCINFFIIRDPRDQIVSLLNHYKNINFNDKEVELLPDDDERLLYMIKKESRMHTIHFMEWLKSPVCCALDFEKLMGAHGGTATHEEAMQEMRKIANALQINPSDKYLEEVYKRHFGKGWNFFKGKVGTWKDYFKDEHKTEIKRQIGDFLIQLGYEKGLDW